MYDKELAKEILIQLVLCSQKILKRMESVQTVTDLVQQDEKLDALCMQLIAIGESLKNFDKVTDNALFPQYPNFDWKRAKAMRDIISHHYFSINPKIVFEVCQNEIPKLRDILQRILQEVF